MQRFGRVKLNKIIWKADFDAFAERGVPVTGRAYQRLPFGPALKEMKPLLREMQTAGLLAEDPTDFGEGVVEYRLVALADPDLSKFTDSDLHFVNRSIEHYFNMTGDEASDDSHGAAWKSRSNHDPMPYQSSYLSDMRPAGMQRERLLALIRDRRLQSH